MPIHRADDDLIAQFRRYAARAIEVRDQQYISQRELAMSNVGFEMIADDARRALILRLRSFFHGMGEDRIVAHAQWPADWWQALKERWFPAWALRRWPVEYRRIDVDEVKYAAVCPHIEDPHRNTHLEWLANTSNGDTYGEALRLGQYEALLHAPWAASGDNSILGYWAEDGSGYVLAVPRELRDMLVALQNELRLAYLDELGER